LKAGSGRYLRRYLQRSIFTKGPRSPRGPFLRTNKEEFRRRQASLSFTEKIGILEQLRDRELAIGKAREKLRAPRSRQRQKIARAKAAFRAIATPACPSKCRLRVPFRR
jgi:hypothetical protein